MIIETLHNQEDLLEVNKEVIVVINSGMNNQEATDKLDKMEDTLDQALDLEHITL